LRAAHRFLNFALFAIALSETRRMVLSTLCGFDAPPFTRSFNDVMIVQTAVAVIAHRGGKKFSAPADALTIAASRAIMDAIRLCVTGLPP
jgi:hypothetical protein